MEETTSILSPSQRHAAAALFALALNQSQIHQGRSPATPRGGGDDASPTTAQTSPRINDNSGLLFPIFRFLGVDEQAWRDLKETTGSSSQFKHNLKDFFKLLSEEGDASSKGRLEKEAELTNAVDSTEAGMKSTADSLSGCHEQKTRSPKNSPDAELKLFAVGSEPHGETKEISTLFPIETQSSTALENGKPLEEASIISYQRKVSVLYTLLSACVADTAEVDKKHFKSKQGYDARHRVSLRLLAVWLDVEWNEMEVMESMVAFSLMEAVSKAGEKDQESVVSETSWDKWKRGGIVGAAAVTGGTIMAITGGLAAPAIAHGLGALAPTLGGTLTFFHCTDKSSVTRSFCATAAGAGLTGSKMATRIGSLEEFELIEVGGTQQGHLAVRISISGLAFEENDFIKPWESYNDNMERYVLKYESKNLIALSTAIQDWLTSKIMTELMRGGAMLTVLSTLVAALAWPATLVTAFDLIDSKWAIAVDRSEKAGRVLSEVLLKGLQGNRPVTLIGFSLGAIVIFKCLQFLAESKEDNAGLVERVVLLGAPISIEDEKWEVARKMVAGRFVNAYSTNDWTLGLAFRASLLSKGLAGIQAVDLPGIENVDVTHIIEGHSSYLGMTPKVLEQLELDNYFPVYKGKVNKKEEAI
ncbi:hypothetical protein RYX36_012884 [Vicia faba]